jgi:hypothetical protein
MRLRSTIAIATLGVSLGIPATSLAAPPSDAQQRYQQERATCLSGQSAQDQSTCLKEAGAALEEARRGRLADGSAQYQQNALARCTVLPPEERGACRARMQGEGTTSGSVEGGGIYRELVTREQPPEPPPPPDARMGADPPR